MQQRRGDDQRAAVEMANALQQSCIGVRVGRLSRLVGRRFDAELRPLALSVPQLEVLGALVVHDASVRPSDLSQWLAVERSTMSRNLTLMERRGYVETTETSPTGRTRRIGITDAGRRALVEAEGAWTRVQQDLLRDLGPDAVPTLDGWLADLAG